MAATCDVEGGRILVEAEAEAERAEAASRMCDDDDDTALAGRRSGRCINGDRIGGERREERRARPAPPAARTDADGPGLRP